MSSDPWLTEDGKVHPAALPLPEWTGDKGQRFRLEYKGGRWWRFRLRKKRPCLWVRDRVLTPREAAALIEKHLQEKLAKRGIWLRPCRTNEIGGWTVEGIDIGPPARITYIAALQAAAEAAKGEDDATQHRIDVSE